MTPEERSDYAEARAEVERLRAELTWKLSAVQVLAGGDEPNIISEFPAANDVRALHKKYRAATAEVERLRDQVAELERVNLTRKNDIAELKGRVTAGDARLARAEAVVEAFRKLKLASWPSPEWAAACVALATYDAGRKP